MDRFILLVTMMWLIINIGGKSIEKENSRMNSKLTVKEDKDTTESLEVTSRSSVIDDLTNYQSSRSFGSKTNTELCYGTRFFLSFLSKIAKVRADEDTDSNILRGPFSRRLFNAKDQKYPSNFELNKNKENVSQSSLPQQSYRCSFVEDVYIPEAGKKLPAYGCLIQNKVFVLTSERFLEDRRPYFDINVDEEMSRNWIVASSNAVGNVMKLPVQLVLKNGENNYSIRDK